MARVDLSNYYAMKGWNVPAAGQQPAYTRQPAPTYSAGPDNSGGTMYVSGWNAQPAYTRQPAPTYSAGPDNSGGTMYAMSTPTAQPTAQATAAPAFDWRLGAWMVANRWAPEWAAKNPYTSITDGKALSEALKGYAPEMKTPAYAAWNNDLKYLQAGLTNTAMPTWYNIKQPWGEVAPTPTPAPSTGYQPAPGVPNFNWANWGGQTATNPIGQYAGTPSWMNDPEWVTKPGMADQAQKWAAVMVPWAQAQQNAYQYQNDANEAQRRYNIDAAWRQAQDQFTMDQTQKTFDYQKVRDQEEFGLARQQIWGRNQTPNTRWMRSWG